MVCRSRGMAHPFRLKSVCLGERTSIGWPIRAGGSLPLAAITWRRCGPASGHSLTIMSGSPLTTLRGGRLADLHARSKLPLKMPHLPHDRCSVRSAAAAPPDQAEHFHRLGPHVLARAWQAKWTEIDFAIGSIGVSPTSLASRTTYSETSKVCFANSATV